MNKVSAVAAACLLLVASCGTPLGEPLGIKPDPFDSGAGIESIAAPGGVLYASTGNAVYRLDRTQWTHLPMPSESGLGDIRLLDVDGRLIATVPRFGDTEIWERVNDYWRMLTVVLSGLNGAQTTVLGRQLFLFNGNALSTVDANGYLKSITSAEHLPFELPSELRPFAFREHLYVARRSQNSTEILDPSRENAIVLRIPWQTWLLAAGDKVWFCSGLDCASWDGSTVAYFTSPVPFHNLLETGGIVYGLSVNTLYRHDPDDPPAVWRLDSTLLNGSVIDDVLSSNGDLYVATQSGIWRRGGNGWKKLDAIQAPVNDLALNGTEVIAATNSGIVSTRRNLAVPTTERPICRTVVSIGEKLEAICGLNPTLFKSTGGQWTRPWKSTPIRPTTLTVSGDDTFVGTTCGIFRETASGPQEVGHLGQTVKVVARVDDDLLAGTEQGLFLWTGSTWTPVKPLLGVPITAISNVTAAPALYVGTAAGQIFRYDAKAKNVSLFAKSVASVTTPAIRALWFRGARNVAMRDVVIAGSAHGLFWSNDGGGNWHAADEKARSVNRIIDGGKPHTLKVATNNGILDVTDDIPDPLWPRVTAFVTTTVREWRWTALIALIIVLLIPNPISLRFVDALPEKAQNVYYLSLAISGFARRRLLHRHKQSLLTKEVVPGVGGRSTLDKALTRYIDLPYQPPAENRLASEHAGELLRTERVVWVYGTAGRGKTLFSWKMVRQIAGAGITPVVIEGYALGASIAESLSSAIQRSGTPVTKPILDALLSHEPITVILDGFSEIRLEFRDRALDDIAAFLSRYENVRMIITSRLQPPAPLLSALGIAQFELLPVTNDALESFVKMYLNKRKPEAANLVKALEETKLGEGQLTPLMLVLITDTYERKGEVPASLTQIYSDYFNHLVREEAIGGLSPAGVKEALEELTSRTFLERDGERGFTEREAIACFAEMHQRLETGFGIKVSAEALLKTLKSSGILLEVTRYLRYFHDSFESYVAARYLDDRFRRREFEPVTKLIAARSTNIALSEVWRFLDDLLAQSGQEASGRLRELEREQRRKAVVRKPRLPGVIAAAAPPES